MFQEKWHINETLWGIELYIALCQYMINHTQLLNVQYGADSSCSENLSDHGILTSADEIIDIPKGVVLYTAMALNLSAT